MFHTVKHAITITNTLENIIKIYDNTAEGLVVIILWAEATSTNSAQQIAHGMD